MSKLFRLQDTAARCIALSVLVKKTDEALDREPYSTPSDCMRAFLTYVRMMANAEINSLFGILDQPRRAKDIEESLVAAMNLLLDEERKLGDDDRLMDIYSSIFYPKTSVTGTEDFLAYKFNTIYAGDVAMTALGKIEKELKRKCPAFRALIKTWATRSRQ